MRRRAAALAGVVAILVQAILFAWHHHALPFSRSAASAGAIATAPASPVFPALADDDCQICFTLAHHGAAPVEFFAPSLPQETPLLRAPLAAVGLPAARYSLFRSRAPPVA
jgi:hypothetical protein